MDKGVFSVPKPINEPIKSYAPGTPERAAVLAAYTQMYHQTVEVPLYINGADVCTGDTQPMSPPHDHQHSLGVFHKASNSEVKQAIDTALAARDQWAQTPWEQRAAIFLRAAELIAGPYRARINAATMLAQSKTVHQAEIDAACEFIDFLRFNVAYMTEMYQEQPKSTSETWNRLEYRPLEGFVYAITPFNFTAIAGNLPSCAALMGNVVVWKPSDAQVFSAQVVLEVFKEAGVPAGVINMIMGDPVMITEEVLNHPDFSGLHFTGSTDVFKNLWQKIGTNIHKYKTYPRIVGETGGKDFIVAHPSADFDGLVTAIIRGAFEFQGQKCSAASRCYVPESLWQSVSEKLTQELKTIKQGSPEDPQNFMTAVIHEASFDKLARFIDQAKQDKDAEIVFGGGYDKSTGYFIEPTVIKTTNPHYTTMKTELFGPVLTVYVYPDNQWSQTLELVDQTSDYALTGAVFSQDRYALDQAVKALENSAGNFYINDKPTGAVVGQQPFGGARASGTNDKAGSKLNLYRWVSPRTVKEQLLITKDYRYPFME
jgi:1-pyrroline-5-carboxylate dehydrogenase